MRFHVKSYSKRAYKIDVWDAMHVWHDKRNVKTRYLPEAMYMETYIYRSHAMFEYI